METFKKLAQKNVDHYDNHPAQHHAMIAVMAVGAVGAFALMGKTIRKNLERPRKIGG